MVDALLKDDNELK
jgi:myosin heavy subunit